MSVEAGHVLSGRFRLVRPVGQGAQATVWIAEHLALSTQVAVKLIDPELAKQAGALERFKREATAAAQLRSTHVVQILDHGVDGTQPFIVMELLEGEDLFERLVKKTRLGLEETSVIVTQVAKALSRAHAAGIVHRDLKPENVFLCSGEDEEVAKVLDFGVAKVIDPAQATMQRTGVGTLIGTPHYMSPEQVKGIGEVDFKTDIWALGVIAYRCVTGVLPFDSEGVGDLLIKITIGDLPVPSRVKRGVPPAFDEWFAKACHREPKKRFASAKDLAEALAKVVTTAKEPAAPSSAEKKKPVTAWALGKPAVKAKAEPEPEKPARAELGSVPLLLTAPTRDPGRDSVVVDFDDEGVGRGSKPSVRPPADAEASGGLGPSAWDEADAAAHEAPIPPPPRTPGEAPKPGGTMPERGATVTGVASVIPPALDGSRKRWVLGVVAVVAFGATCYGTWRVVWPNIVPPNQPPPRPTAVAAEPPPPATFDSLVPLQTPGKATAKPAPAKKGPGKTSPSGRVKSGGSAAAAPAPAPEETGAPAPAPAPAPEPAPE